MANEQIALIKEKLQAQNLKQMLDQEKLNVSIGPNNADIKNIADRCATEERFAFMSFPFVRYSQTRALDKGWSVLPRYLSE